MKREYELLGFYLNGHPLDDYRAQLQPLSCVPLKELERLPDGSVCRIACIIEALTIRISAKRQKKFAILIIGDGSERFELPIWPDLYEQKAALLTENQLLYAIVQVERNGSETKIQCRWLEDLTKVDESMIRACDEAVDRAKSQVRKQEWRDRKQEGPKPSPKPQEVKMTSTQLTVRLQMEHVRLSHILQLKQAFRTHSGQTPIHINFLLGHQAVHTLKISGEWGVSASPELEKQIRSVSSVIALEWSQR